MKKYSLIIIIIIVLFNSCDSIVEDLNNDPNSLTTSSFQSVLTGAEVGNSLFQTGESARRACIFAGQYTGIDRQHLGFSQYTVTTSDFNELWYDAYVNAYRNAYTAQELAIENNIGSVSEGITQVLQALIIGSTTSLYGDVPFEEAGQTAIENPVYETQPEIYQKLQDLLDTAIINLEENTGLPASGSEIYFNGDPQAWVEVAHSLKARLYLQNKAYEEAYQEALQGISSDANSLYSPHGEAADNRNLNYQFFAVEVRQSDLIVSDFMASLIDSSSENPIPNNYRGNNKTDETARYNFYFNTTDIGIQPNTVDGFAAPAAPAPILTYQENLLILAEAGFRTNGFITGLENLNNFRNYMNNGGYLQNVDSENIQYEAYTSTDFQQGGIANTENLNANDALLKEILEERYVTLFGQLEPFNDTRRTQDETSIRVPVQPNTGDQLPQRFIYPQSEIDRNNNTPQPIPNFFDRTPINQ